MEKNHKVNANNATENTNNANNNSKKNTPVSLTIQGLDIIDRIASVDTENEKPKKRHRSIKPLNKVLRDARTTFSRQLKKDGGVKKDSLGQAVARNSALYPDTLRFELDFKKERDRLLDSTKFMKFCERNGLTPAYVADHILFEGKGAVNKTLLEGPEFLGERVFMFNCPLWEDHEGLYEEKEVVNA